MIMLHRTRPYVENKNCKWDALRWLGAWDATKTSRLYDYYWPAFFGMPFIYFWVWSALLILDFMPLHESHTRSYSRVVVSFFTCGVRKNALASICIGRSAEIFVYHCCRCWWYGDRWPLFVHRSHPCLMPSKSTEIRCVFIGVIWGCLLFEPFDRYMAAMAQTFFDSRPFRNECKWRTHGEWHKNHHQPDVRPVLCSILINTSSTHSATMVAVIATLLFVFACMCGYFYSHAMVSWALFAVGCRNNSWSCHLLKYQN